MIGGRLWFYSNYHCNLTCTYCLTDSAPDVPRRELAPDLIRELAREAPALGFESLGVTGGEPFLLPGLPHLLGEMSESLPVLVLSNGTAFAPRVLRELQPLAGGRVAVQLSLDSAEPDSNDAARGRGNHARVLTAIRKLRAIGIGVRIATTSGGIAGEALQRLCELHRSLGVPDEDHVVRPIVRRGRASANSMGVDAGISDLPPELTITADGAFWSPFAPTVTGGRLDTDLLLTRTIRPLEIPARSMALVAGGPLAAPNPALKIT